MCDTDDDGDGIEDGSDSCPNTPPGTQVNASGCTDTDGDGITDGADNCPLIANSDQADADGDTVSAMCVIPTMTAMVSRMALIHVQTPLQGHK